MWHDGWGAGNWLLMSVMIVLFWVFAITFVVWVVRGRRTAAPPDEHRARQILDERLARGDIDADEYTELREHLSAR